MELFRNTTGEVAVCLWRSWLKKAKKLFFLSTTKLIDRQNKQTKPRTQILNPSKVNMAQLIFSATWKKNQFFKEISNQIQTRKCCKKMIKGK